MQIVQTAVHNAVQKVFNTFLNMNVKHEDEMVDVRDIGMVARYTRPANPLNGWGLMVIDAVSKHQSARDAWKVTEEGYLYFEARLFAEIQDFFRERTGLIVSVETISKFEREASGHCDYCTRIARSCMLYEQEHTKAAA